MTCNEARTLEDGCLGLSQNGYGVCGVCGTNNEEHGESILARV